MELIKELGSRSWINGSGKKDSRKFGLFVCPVCNTEVEKSLSHGKRDKNCGSKACRKVTFERNPNMLQTSKANGNAKKSKYLHGDDPMWRNFSKVFYEMHRRCYNPKNHAYKNYGVLGIVVSDQWHDLNTFTIDMFDGYKEAMLKYDGTRGTIPSLDRVDNNGNYSKENCTWITLSENIIKDKQIPVVRMDMDGNILETYASMTEATKFSSIYGSTLVYPHTHGIGECCKGRMLEHVGYKWAYATSKTMIKKQKLI
jgi:hypothetical protein